MLRDVQGVTEQISQLSDNMKELHQAMQTNQMDSNQVADQIQRLQQAIKGLVDDTQSVQGKLAVSMADLGASFGDVLKHMNEIRNANPTAQMSQQLEQVQLQVQQFIQAYSQLSDLKLNINSTDLTQVNETVKTLTGTVKEMQQVLSTGDNANAFAGITQELDKVSQIMGQGNLINNFTALTTASNDLIQSLEKGSTVAQNNSLAVKTLGDQFSALSMLTNEMSNGVDKLYAKIAGPGSDIRPFGTMKEELDAITSALSRVETQVKSADTWKNPEALGAQTQLIEQSLQRAMASQNDAFSQVLGRMTTANFDKEIENFTKTRDYMRAAMESAINILSDPNQAPIVPMEKLEEVNRARQKAMNDLHQMQQQMAAMNPTDLQAHRQTNFNYETAFHGHRIMGQYDNNYIDRDSARSELMRMASGRTYGNDYEYGIDGVGRAAVNIQKRATILASEVNDPNSAMPYQERRAARNIDFQGIASEAQELARMRAEFNEAKDMFSGSYSKATQSGDPQHMEDAKKRYEVLIKMQQDIQKRSISLGKAIQIASPEDKERLGKDVTALWQEIKKLVGDASSSSDNLYMMGKMLNVDPKIISGLKDGTNGVKDIKNALDDAEKSSKSLWDSMKSGMSDMLAPLHMLGKGLTALGLGSLGGGVLGTMGKTIGMYSDQQRNIWDSMRIGASYGMSGLDSDAMGRAERRRDEGIRLHDMSGGRIGINELNNAYNSAFSSVGGGYGRTAAQGSADMDSLVRNTFAMQKVHNIDQGTMNEAYQTFYKDMRQSASDAADAIARVTSTAAAANIPVAGYLKMMTGIAQQYLRIGMSGKDAENVLGNLIHQGMRADVARDMAQQTGNAMGKFADDNNQVGYAAAMLGMDPWQGIGMAYNSHDSKGDPRKAWAQDMSKMMDVMVNTYSDAAGGDPDVKRKVLGDYFRGMGYDRRSASAMTNAHLEGNTEQFQKLLMEAEDKKDNPNAAMENELKNMAGILSGQDRLMASINSHLNELATKIGPDISRALLDMKGPIIKFVDSIGELVKMISTSLSNFTKSGLFQNTLKPGMEWAVESPGHMAATLGGLWLGKRALTGGLGMPRIGTSTEARAGSRVWQTMVKNPRASAAILAGAAAFGIGSKALASPRWDGGDSDGVLGHMASRLDDIYGTMSGEGINIKGGERGHHGGFGTSGDAPDLMMGAAGVGGMYLATNKLFSMAGANVGGEAAQAGTSMMGLIGKQTPIGLRKVLGNAAKSPWTAAFAELGLGAYDLYDHHQQGNLVQGDFGRVGANAGVNLGYVGMGALLGSVVPGVGTAIGAGVGGLVGLGVDAFGSRDDDGRNFNDRLKNSLTHMATGKWDYEIEDERRKKDEENAYGKDPERALKAKLKMLGYSDTKAEEMSKALYNNKDELEKHGVKFGEMTLDQKAFFAEHAKQLGVNKEGLGKNESAVNKATEEMRNLAAAIRNTPLGEKINKSMSAKEQAVHDQIGAGLSNRGELHGILQKKEGDLTAWKETLEQNMQDDPRRAGVYKNQLDDVNKKIFEMQRGKYYLEDPEGRKEHWGSEYDKLNGWQQAWAGPRDSYIKSRLKEDNDYAYNYGQLYKDEYIKSKIDAGASDDSRTAEEQVESAITGNNREAEDTQQIRADDSRLKAANVSADKIVKQETKNEEQLKTSNKLLIDLTDNEKALFKTMEAAAHNDTKLLLAKLDEIKLVLESIKLASGGGASSKFTAKGIGALSAKYESSGDPGMVSDLDGGSYGIYQFNDLGVDSFMETLKKKNHPAYALLSKYQKGSAGFGEAWKQAASQFSDFGDIQHQHIKETEYDPFVESIRKKYGLDINTRGAGVQSAIWSTVVQHGQGDGASVMKNALAGKNISTISDEELLDAIYDERGRNGGSAHFSGQSEEIKAAVVDRFLREKLDAKALNKTGFTQDVTTPKGLENQAIQDAVVQQTQKAADNAEVQKAVSEATGDGSAAKKIVEDAIKNPTGIVGTPDYVTSRQTMTNKAFYDGTMIKHHLGGMDAYYGDSNSQLNWGSIANVISQAGGTAKMPGRKEVQAKAHRDRMTFDEAMASENTMNAKKGMLGIPNVQAPLIDHTANIEIKTNLDNKPLLDAQEQKTQQPKGENAGQEVNLNISVSGNETADKMLPGILDALRAMGYKVEKIEKQVSETSATAVRAMGNTTNLNQRLRSQDAPG